MLNAASTLTGFEICARDGSLGSVNDLLFDDSSWKVRWIVVDTGHWLTGRKVLVRPSAVIAADHGAHQFHVALSKRQVEDSPDLAQDHPVSRQMQSNLYIYYGWDPLWGAGMYAGGGMGAIASRFSAPSSFGAEAAGEPDGGRTDLNEGDPHLRSIVEVTGYYVHATDGEIGHIEDVLVDNASWDVRYLVVDTSNWWFGQHVLISPSAAKSVDWSDRYVWLDIARERVRSSPPWNPAQAINREYEQRLHGHYKCPGYGW